MKHQSHIEGHAVPPVVDLLMRGRARVAQGWRKHGLAEKDGEVCILAGIGGRDGIQMDGPPVFFQAQHFLYLALGRTEEAPGCEGIWVAKYNDARETTQADILALYDRAIDLALTA